MPGLPQLKRGGRKRWAKQANDTPHAGAAKPVGFQVDRCEYVSIDTGSTLLRLEGRPGEGSDLRGLTLLVHSGETHLEHSLLGSPTRVGDEPSERWQLAFGIATESVEDPDARFEL